MSPSDLALYQIETELAELLALRDQVEDEGGLPEDLAAIDKQIEAYCSAEVAKVDRIAGAIRACERNYDAALAEATRLKEQAKAWDARKEAIKGAALRAMQARGIKSLETPTNRLSVCGNGGLEPLAIEGERIPGAFVLVTMRLRSDMVGRLMDVLRASTDQEMADALAVQLKPTEVDNRAIREALKRGESVPGAKLLPRGEHLRLK